MKRNHGPFLDLLGECYRLFFFGHSNFGLGPGVSVVAPNAQENTEGNSSNIYPYNAAATGMRYQQVFDASQFSDPEDW